MKILVTGSAGFIGFYTVKHFVELGYQVVGLDNLNEYYDIELKYGRLKETGIAREDVKENEPAKSVIYPNYRFFKADLTDKVFIDQLFEVEQFDQVCNLAAQAGVRYSINNPYSYINSNVVGFLNILEACRFNPVKHLIYASSSSVYGLNKKVPFSESDKVDTPVSLYAASKKTNELMAHSYSKLFGIPTTGLRFFTVYGPWGRPDMAPFLFMDAIANHRPIEVYNHGLLMRDFTYIDDVVRGLSAVMNYPPEAEVPYKIYNIGRGKPMKLPDFIAEIESVTGNSAVKKMTGMQDGDVYQTYADTSQLEYDVHFIPRINIHEGIKRFYNWYVDYVNLNKSNI